MLSIHTFQQPHNTNRVYQNTHSNSHTTPTQFINPHTPIATQYQHSFSIHTFQHPHNANTVYQSTHSNSHTTPTHFINPHIPIATQYQHSLSIHTFQHPHNTNTVYQSTHSNSHTIPTQHINPHIPTTTQYQHFPSHCTRHFHIFSTVRYHHSTDDVTQWAGSTDRHRLSYSAEGVEIALFKGGQVPDCYRWLGLFVLVLYVLPLSLPCHSGKYAIRCIRR